MYSILRTAKIKDRQKITSAAEHNFRIRNQGNIDTSRTVQNKILVNTLNVDTTISNDLQMKLTDHYNQLGVKEKKDNVLMLEFVVSASPDFFDGKSILEVQDWVDTQVSFFKDEFGENMKMAVLHLDEKTPHIHFMISTEMKSEKKYKNQHRNFFKTSYSLNAKRWDPEFLMGLHDRHALVNAKYGLVRGKKGSNKPHKTVKEYYHDLNNQELELAQKMVELDQYKEETESDLQTMKKFKDAYPTLKKTILNSYEAIKDLFDILEGKDLSDDELEVISGIANKVPKVKKNKKLPN